MNLVPGLGKLHPPQMPYPVCSARAAPWFENEDICSGPALKGHKCLHACAQGRRRTCDTERHVRERIQRESCLNALQGHNKGEMLVTCKPLPTKQFLRWVRQSEREGRDTGIECTSLYSSNRSLRHTTMNSAQFSYCMFLAERLCVSSKWGPTDPSLE